jgi:pimeloyl-ACP methyl ester carboxylesterase
METRQSRSVELWVAERDNKVRGFAARLGMFACLLVVLQFGVSAAFPARVPGEVLRLEGYLDKGVDIVYLGDSTLTYPVGEVTTGKVLQEMLPDLVIGEVAHPAYGMDLYERYVQYVVRTGRRPGTIVLPINMRSFSPEWDRRPGYQFEQEKKVLSLGLFAARILARPLEVFGAFEPGISQDEFLDTVVYDGDTPVGRVSDFESLGDQGVAESLEGDAGFAYHDALPSQDDEEALQKALIYYYMYRLDEGHRKLEAMVEIARLCQERDLDVVFYLSPVNYQQGERVLGSAFRDRLAENVELVKSALSAVNGQHVKLLDLTFDLEAYAFVDMEHLHETGKTYLAQQIAAAVDATVSQTEPSVEATATPIPGPVAARTAAKPTVTELPQATETPLPTHTQPSPTSTMPATATATALVTTVGTSGPSISATAAVTVTPTSLVPFEIIEDTGPKPGAVTEARVVAHFKPEGRYPVDMVRLGFWTTDEQARLVEIEADVYLPQVTVTSSFPVLVYAAGTTGLSDDCTPLDEQERQRNWGNYQGHSLAYAAQGYVVVLSDWLGLDDPERSHPYFVSETQAHVVLDAARAAYDLFDGAWLEGGDEQTNDTPLLASPSKAVFLMGYSSGGHAIFAAKDYAIRYAPDLVIKGIIGHGPTTNVETLLREDAVFSPYIVYAYREFYGKDVIDPADVFAPRWVETFEADVMSKCVDDIFEYYSRSARTMYSDRFRNILFGGSLPEEFPLFAEKLTENYAGVSGGAHIPVLILQGTGDMVVTPSSQKKFVRELCAMGTSVAYWEYPAVPHTQIRWVSFSDTLVWMRSIARGTEARSDCGQMQEN